MLFIFGGLPGVGKTALSQALARRINAAYLRIDTIEQCLKNSGFNKMFDEAYQIAFSLALENLRNQVPVVADSTNPVAESRSAWREVATKAQVKHLEIEVICSDVTEHKWRVENRTSDIPNLVLPTWESVCSREYQPWTSANIVIDTAGKTIEQSKSELLQAIGST